MTITVKHAKTSTIPDGADTDLVRPSDWNADHTLTGLGTMAEQNASSVAITGGSINGTSLGATTAASAKVTTLDIGMGLTLATDAGTAGQVLTSAGAGSVPTWTSNGTGDVVGPASATDNAVARYDSTTGKLIQNSTVVIDDNGNTSLNAVSFDTTPATLPTAPGSLYWDSADNNATLSLIMAGSNAVQQIGEETYFRIKASAAITEGQVVMFTGTVGASGGLTGAPATGLTATTASYIMGIATHSMALNDWGYVTAFGLVRGIDATGGAESWVNGQILYYDPSVTGGLTKTAPSAPNAKVQVCAVVYANANGSVFVRPTFGGALGQYEGDVGITSPANGDLLIRNQTDGKWVNAPLTAGTGISVTNGTGSITVANTGVTSVSGTAPIASSGGTTPAISISQATTSTDGYLSSTDWNTFNNKVSMVYPGSGIPVSTGSAWGTSKTAPSGTIVGTTDSQTLSNKQLQAYNETCTTVGTVSTTTYNIDLSLSNIFDITLGNNVTFTFTNPPSSGIAKNCTVILRQDATGSRLATFTNAKYTDGTAPILSTGASQVDVLTFFTVNGGSFWFGTFAMANVS